MAAAKDIFAEIIVVDIYIRIGLIAVACIYIGVPDIGVGGALRRNRKSVGVMSLPTQHLTIGSNVGMNAHHARYGSIRQITLIRRPEQRGRPPATNVLRQLYFGLKTTSGVSCK